MKIVEILIENLGPYIGENRFDFSVDDPNKKVILIGGKNGAGKTTLFNSIRVGLYGCRAFGYESNNAKYYEAVSSLINSSAKREKVGKAGIKISILMDDGKDDYVYTFERYWPLNLKSIKEITRITRNGKELTETENSDFQSYLLQLIPPDMFRFYFFDGESIGNFVFNGVKNTDFKNAFLKLCGLDTMEIIYDNFQRLANAKRKDSYGVFEEYQTVKEEYQQACDNLEIALQRKEVIISQVVCVDEELAKCEADFVHRGGITKAEYNAMHSQLSKEEAKRDVSRRWLKEAANDYLPFVILKPQILALKDRIAAEDKARFAETLMDCLNNAEVRSNLSDAFSDEGIDAPFLLADKVISVLEDSVKTDECEQILCLSRSEQMSVLAKIEAVQAFDTTQVFSNVAEIEESLDRVKAVRAKLDKSDGSGAEAYFEKKDSLMREKTSALQEQLSIERSIEGLRLQLEECHVKLKKAQQKYEDYLKAKSVSDVTAKALLAFSELQKRLYKKYIADVENNFRMCFAKLINKSDLIDGIKIDSDLQVYPYKLHDFERDYLTKLLSDGGKAEFIDQLGEAAYDEFVCSSSQESTIALPVEVRQQLSAGEKQIFIMALYQALSSLNKVSVPYIIDTPFSRIDTEHRKNILNNFFMSLRGQMMILSTDEEIVGQHKDSIKDVISDYYLLLHEDNNGTQVLPNTYFSEV